MASTSVPGDSNPKIKNIANPRRLLILTPTSQSLTTIPPLLHALTGVPVTDPPQQETANTSPSQPSTLPSTTPTTTSFAGYTTHSPLRLSTKYYTAEVPLWVDEIPLSTETTETTSSQWCTEFLSAEAEIVRDAVGALVVCVRAPEPSSSDKDTGPIERQDVRAIRELMRDVAAVKSCIDEERGGVGDVPGVLILVGSRKSVPAASSKDEDALELGVGDDGLGEDAAPLSVGWWEDQMFDMGLFGWEVIEWDPTEQGEVTRNKFGEYEGMPRIKEVLETHDWTASGDTLEADELGSDDDFEDFMSGDNSHSRGFGEEVNELEREMFGLRMAIERGGDGHEDSEEDGNEEDKVESIEALMMRMQSIRDMSAELPEAQRKKFAAKAVQDIMRDL
ncbi:hypothetical protein PENDEC_c016G06340 [Penicillium decumbens]|uniref:Alpha/gamma-adaptin-binding protein p34 n=1 Tax=Penicillium decumbens TaxID=69771 RepID=A0A1V6P8H4_PENDC|nr:hypothetical protein PENDEC_c016G06340 [Penicillium decumbens]